MAVFVLVVACFDLLLIPAVSTWSSNPNLTSKICLNEFKRLRAAVYSPSPNAIRGAGAFFRTGPLHLERERYA